MRSLRLGQKMTDQVQYRKYHPMFLSKRLELHEGEQLLAAALVL